ncbi:hypothetical protein SAMN04488523_106144 [Sulfitobacter brevis]|uniref:DUF2155 domain-containing protein n=1 Tax=Sulfitobacter brevis TaxID=74348 RepID=A0A1I1ZG12_9RHOB|nr:DUF2155 domain-containing protein [Sulfitobacter brevis]SFE30696.1 hypothetical protein SAMN04488523_106144 [Sulfitobacter brevis]
MLKYLSLMMICAAAPLAAQQASNAPAGVLRALDKTSGNTADVELREGQTARLGLLSITMNECRYPEGNPSGDAYAELTITEEGETRPVFSGWMIASSPALSAMEHQRYDVWVIRCVTS